jgi:hypothetical protein
MTRPIVKSAADTMELETLRVRQDGAVLFADIAAGNNAVIANIIKRDALRNRRRLVAEGQRR